MFCIYRFFGLVIARMKAESLIVISAGQRPMVKMNPPLSGCKLVIISAGQHPVRNKQSTECRPYRAWGVHSL